MSTTRTTDALKPWAATDPAINRLLYVRHLYQTGRLNEGDMPARPRRRVLDALRRRSPVWTASVVLLVWLWLVGGCVIVAWWLWR